MKKMKKKIFWVYMAGMVALSFVSCKGKDSGDVFEDIILREDFISVYDSIGKDVTIDKVFERDGLAFVEINWREYELGMDFLSMAMVYNVAPMGEFKTEEEVYNEWWRLYVQRWNALVPEVPLYSNQ